MYCIYNICTFLYEILITSNAIKIYRIISIAFGTVHSNRTVVVLLYKHFSS